MPEQERQAQREGTTLPMSSAADALPPSALMDECLQLKVLPIKVSPGSASQPAVRTCVKFGFYCIDVRATDAASNNWKALAQKLQAEVENSTEELRGLENRYNDEIVPKFNAAKSWITRMDMLARMAAFV